MKNHFNKIYLIFLAGLLALLLLGLYGIARAQQPAPAGANAVASSVGNAFTYQGQLKDASGLVANICDFQFGLWDALTSGTQIGSTLTQTGVSVNQGLFTVQLDFGANAFSGSARWLETSVRCPAGSGSYSTLTPRQPLTPAPYAQYSADADRLDGQHAAAFQQHYQNLVVVAKSGGDFTTITDALNSITTNNADNPFTIYVAPGIYTETVAMKPYVDIEGAGEHATKITFTSNSIITSTLKGADHAELRFLTVENSGGDFYAVAILNSGASPALTHVTASVFGGTDNYGVLNAHSLPKMTDMTITASGGTNDIDVYNLFASPTMTSITLTASGGTFGFCLYNALSSPTMIDVIGTATATNISEGMYNYTSSPNMRMVTLTASSATINYGSYNDINSIPMMMDVTSIASGGGTNCGILNSTSSPTMTNVIVTASGGTSTNYGVYNYTNSPTMSNVSAKASGGTNNYGVYNDHASPLMTRVTTVASGGTNNLGVYNSYSSPVMTDVIASAYGGTHNYGVYNSYSSPMIRNSVISARDGTNDGIHNTAASGSYTVNINNSQISAGTSTIYQDGTYTTRLGASQLAGGGVFGGVYVCAASYSGNYIALDNTCH